MKRQFLFAVMLLVSLPLFVAAQSTESKTEEMAVRQSVDAYLSKKDPELVKRVLSPDAKIITVDSRNGRVLETPANKPAKERSSATVGDSSQSIVAIDVTVDGASVKVETEFPADMKPAVAPRKHVQYISLLKLNGEWKIVSILMPPLRFTETASK